MYKKNEVNNENLLRSLSRVNIPDGYEVEIITVSDEENLAAAYNQALEVSEAKYNIYIRDAVYIENINFIKDILDIFSEQPDVGMIGVSGTESFAATTKKWNSIRNYGQVLDNNTDELRSWQQPVNKYHEVQILDDYLIATQYDIPWREDIFTRNAFVVEAQCIEFKRENYKTVVAFQETPWCRVEIRNFEDEIAKNVFLDEYSEDIYPLVSILMPTHNRPEYFEIALRSALGQTYRHIEIIISDDSDDDLTKAVVEKYLPNRKIKYYQNKGFTFSQNFIYVLDQANGEYFNYLLDDDIFDVDKISQMIDYYLNSENVSIVTSHRQIIDAEGNFLPEMSFSKKIANENVIVQGRVIEKNIVKNLSNFIGEPTTVLLKISARECMKKIIAENAEALVDLHTWIALCQEGNVVYLVNTLSYFRIHNEQYQNNLKMAFAAAYDWYKFIASYEGKYPEDLTALEYNHAMSYIISSVVDSLKEIYSEVDIRGQFTQQEITEINRQLLEIVNNMNEYNKKRQKNKE